MRSLPPVIPLRYSPLVWLTSNQGTDGSSNRTRTGVSQGQAAGRTGSLSGSVQGREGCGSLIQESGSRVVIPSHDISSPKGVVVDE
mgnify:CR=1 FL=1